MSRGGWLQTYSGCKFHPFDPKPEEVRIEDIAHALSNLCRFAGHTKVFYSVAQHSYLVAEHCPPTYQLLGLLHDAAEAYLMDLPSPVKNDSSMADYRLLEARVQAVIFKAFQVALPPHAANGMPPVVAHIDAQMLATEARDLLGPPPEPWLWLPDPYLEVVQPVAPQMAETEFLRAFAQYGGVNP